MSATVTVVIGAAERLFGRAMRVPVTMMSCDLSALTESSRARSAASFAEATGSPIWVAAS